MATNKYVSTGQAAGSKVSAGLGFPGRVLALQGTYEKTAADNDTSVLRLGRVPANAKPLVTLSKIGNDALTGASDVDLGFYKPGANGAVVDKDCLSDGLDIASGAALGSERRAFQAVGLDEWGQENYLLAGQTAAQHDEEYDVAITGNTFGTATGTISWELYFLLPQQ